MIQALTADFHSGLRHLRSNPEFTAVAVLMLGGAIAAATVVFAVMNGLLLKPLPFHRPEQLVGLQSVNAARSLVQPALSASDFRDVATSAVSFSAIGAYRPDFVTWRREEGRPPIRWITGLVTEEFFKTLGVQPRVGRIFGADEFSVTGPGAILLGEALWKSQFGGASDVIGRVLVINDEPRTVVGVMPASFREPQFADVWLPMPREAPEYMARDSRFWTTIGRLAPGKSIGEVRAEVATIAADLASHYPATNRNWSIRATPLQELRVGHLQFALVCLAGAVGLVLAVACLNLANLLLARGTRRMAEMAVRQALGATPSGLLRQVLAENLLIAALGGAVGIALASAGLWFVRHAIPVGLMPRIHEVGMDGTVLLFVVGVTVLTGLVAGSMPAIQASHAQLEELMREGGARSSQSPRLKRMRSGLLVLQLAFTISVLTAAGWLAAQLHGLRSVDPGFATNDVVRVQLAPTTSQYESNEDLARYYERLVAAAESTPGVVRAAVNPSTPLTGITLSYPFWLHGQAQADGDADTAVYAPITPGFFETLKIPLIEGRAFAETDRTGGAPVVIINAALARRLAPDGSALGRRLMVVPWLSNEYREIVGVVGDTRQDNLFDQPPPQVYVPQAQMPWFFSSLVVRTEAGAGGVLPALRASLTAADPGLAVNFVPMTRHVENSLGQPRLYAVLFASFGVITLGLSLFGIYAGVSFSVAERLREFGLRMALGATPTGLLGHVLGEVARVAVTGAAIGLAMAFALVLVLESNLPRVAALDFTHSILLAGAAVLAALAAAVGPAWRASRIAPASALQT